MEDGKNFRCQFCNMELKNQGSVNLHERKCKNNPNRVEGNNKKPICEHSWRLLTERTPREYNAMKKGYKEVCEKCLEVQ